MNFGSLAAMYFDMETLSDRDFEKSLRSQGGIRTLKRIATMMGYEVESYRADDYEALLEGIIKDRKDSVEAAHQARKDWLDDGVSESHFRTAMSKVDSFGRRWLMDQWDINEESTHDEILAVRADLLREIRQDEAERNQRELSLERRQANGDSNPEKKETITTEEVLELQRQLRQATEAQRTQRAKWKAEKEDLQRQHEEVVTHMTTRLDEMDKTIQKREDEIRDRSASRRYHEDERLRADAGGGGGESGHSRQEESEDEGSDGIVETGEKRRERHREARSSADRTHLRKEVENYAERYFSTDDPISAEVFGTVVRQKYRVYEYSHLALRLASEAFLGHMDLQSHRVLQGSESAINQAVLLLRLLRASSTFFVEKLDPEEIEQAVGVNDKAISQYELRVQKLRRDKRRDGRNQDRSRDRKPGRQVPGSAVYSGCRVCGSKEHRAVDCPKKGNGGGAQDS